MYDMLSSSSLLVILQALVMQASLGDEAAGSFRALKSLRHQHTDLSNTTFGKPRGLKTLRTISSPVPPKVVGSRHCRHTSHLMYYLLRHHQGQCVRMHARADARRDDSGPETRIAMTGVTMCGIENLNECTTSQLEGMYIDTLWDYYRNGRQTLTNEEFDRLKMELYWQGSCVPNLRRYEIQFTKALLAYACGKPLLSIPEYEILRNRIKSSSRLQDITRFLLRLYSEGIQNVIPEQFERLMDDQGIGIRISRKFLAERASSTDTLLSVIGTVFVMEVLMAVIFFAK
eukprot:gnl/MRDRNA2_/MRDRNA2_157906_c0_seq1.p1 gnl/MRDRNA2_/MRDRNA2_157906_c0~~gnl/MRDRNA2_/MRDRNA2_157906_c0_seq1.p1  ORF type:complete len:287 (+),score=33.68 gnl/MRDRNA2_/MRDRNA2_157906_c0_seq1:53-913(+)